ncbi:hypothetical protein [Streptomyces sp. NPDC059071]|uniref:hypothetical protein n=1 Tax=unclassified Streptomyces TaxID=2593676 RepID=UPI00363FAAF5
METYLNLALIRFGLVAGGLVILALLAFAVAVTLRRKGRLDDVRPYVDPVLRAGLRAATRRLTDGRGTAAGARRRSDRW